ncbi:hypothetical protein N7507_005437 [Penicillium longicatenatum]|nr:hypothetical protein N7507_005437 [Penicillium longicatenatum]
MGSTTVFGSIYTSWMLRSVNVIGLGLSVLWALSPLAAQSSLRILSADHGKTLSSPRLNYLNITATANVTALADWKWTNDPSDEMFIGGLVTAKITKGSTTDLWGNVKVPLLSNLTSDTSNWTEVAGDNVVYTSQLGIPIFGLVSNGSTSASVETSYLEFRCQDLYDRAFEGSNVSALAVPNIKYVNGTNTEAIVTWKSFNFINSWSRDNKPVAEATCAVTSRSVMMDVNCNLTSGSTRKQGGCAATRIRQGQSDTTLPGIFSTPTIFDNFTSSILKAIPSGQPAAATGLDYWMANPYGSYPDFRANISLYELDPAIFSQRLTQMVNSFYVARLGYSFMTRTSLAGLQLSARGNQTTVKPDTGSAVFAAMTGNAVEINSTLTLHTNPGWITAFILTILIMIAASILTFFLGSATLIPEILGYVSSLTLDNPHIPLGDIPVTVAGLEKARMLGSIHLRMGDVTPGEDLGTLGVGRLSSTTRSKTRRIFR